MAEKTRVKPGPKPGSQNKERFLEKFCLACGKPLFGRKANQIYCNPTPGVASPCGRRYRRSKGKVA